MLMAAAALLMASPAGAQGAGAQTTGAQTAGAQSVAIVDFPLLAPTPEGDPLHPSVFRKPKPSPPTPVTTPSRIGQLPTFDDQPAMGAGATGFNSSNTRPKPRGKKVPLNTALTPEGAVDVAPAPPPTSAPPPAVTAQTALPPVTPARAIGDARLLQNQNQTRHGAPVADATPTAATALAAAPTIALPPLDASAVPRTLIRRPLVDDKPFDPVGIAAGSFRPRPAIEVSGGYDTNPARTTAGGGASNFGIVAPELLVNSDWSRHALTADLRGSYISYGAQPSQDRPAFNGRVDGRIDVTRDTRIDLESRLVIATDNPGSPNIQAGLARLPISADVGGSAGLGQRFNRLDVSLKGGIDRTTYQNSVFTDGTSASNDDRNFDQYSAQLRTGYELTPGTVPFIELDADRRHRDLPIDSSGYARDSDGRAVQLGLTFEFSRILTGQVALGYTARTYADQRLLDVNGPTLNGALIWVASALTTVKLAAVTTTGESTLAGVSGVFTHELGIEVDHAFRTWLEATLKFTGDRDDYVGDGRQDNRYAASAALTYKLNREWQLKGELRREWLSSNQPGNNYQAYVALLGVRLQR
jgi:hypothetical protein